MKENEHVKTAIRWRPANGNDELVLEKVSDNILCFGKNNRTFMFDHVIDNSDQNEVYDLLVKPLVDKAFEGYDCTFLASGQTGSGKTYTMGFEKSVECESDGMTTRIIKSIFSCPKRVTLLVSFVEVYNDQVFDLLGDRPREAIKKDYKVSEATKILAKSENEVLQLLSQGTNKRRVRGTKMNPISSRSHVIFTIILKIEHEAESVRQSVINLVDLAGSEGFSKSGNTGTAQFEGKSINEGLSALKRVISAMAQAQPYIPYRDSVISNVLRNSLKSNCFLTLLGCVSPYKKDYGETLSTLTFVSEAKSIKKTPYLNELIKEFQKSRTPVKKFPTTATPRKLPLNPSTLQNRGSVTMTEPRQLKTLKRLDNRSHIFQTTIKKQILSNTRLPKRSSTAHRALFPSGRRTIIHSAIENSIKNDITNVTFGDVSTSSKFDFKYQNHDSPKKALDSTYFIDHPSKELCDMLEKFKTKLQATNFYDNKNHIAKIQDIFSEFMDKLNEEIDSKSSDSIVGSFQQFDKPRLSAVNEIESTTKECTVNTDKEQVANGDKSTKEMDQIENQTENIVNLSVHIDHDDKKILVEMPTTGTNNKNTYSTTNDDILGTTIMNDTMQSPNKQNVVCEELITSTTIPYSSPNVTTCPNDQVRTPIGVLRFRKRCSQPNKTDNTMYEVVLVDQNPDIDNSKNIRSPIGYPLPEQSAKASKSSAKCHRFPMSPRVILQRINSLDEYNKYNKIDRKPPPTTKTSTKAKSSRAKGSARTSKKPTRINLRQEILNILNNGSEKDLSKRLQMIGPKTAKQLFTYRAINGAFDSIDGLLTMPFWTEKMHQRFLAKNILI